MNCRKCGKKLVFLASGGGKQKVQRVAAMHKDDESLISLCGTYSAEIDGKIYYEYDAPFRSQRDARRRLELDHAPTVPINENVADDEYQSSAPQILDSLSTSATEVNETGSRDGHRVTMVDQQLGLAGSRSDGEVLAGALDNG